MGTDKDDFGEIFEGGPWGRPAESLTEVLERMTEMMEEGKVALPDILEALLNMVRPGSTENSHDVLQQFIVSMYALGYGEVGKQVEALWLTMFPWGLGFHIGFNREYPVPAMSKEARKAIHAALCGILQAGSIKAVLTDEGRIRITGEDGDEHDVDINRVVAEFRDELDQELGPDAKPEAAADEQEITDWMRRWMT